MARSSSCVATACCFARSPHEDWLLGRSLAGGQLYRDFLPRGERGFVLLARTATDAKENTRRIRCSPIFRC